MMDFESFFKLSTKKGIEIEFDNPSNTVSHRLSNEALFHLPLLAMTILILAKNIRKPKSEEIGQLVGECYERSFSGFKGSSQHLGWSANLRMRTVKALTFLEIAGLVIVDQSDSKIKATDKGKKVIKKVTYLDTNLAYTLLLIERNYRDLKVEKQIALELV